MALSAAAGAALSGIASTGINFLSAPFNKRQQDRANKATRENMNHQHELDINSMNYQNMLAKQNWEMENERQDWLNANSKRIEVQAFRNAGLNPALAGAGSGYQAPPTMSTASPVGLASSAPASSGYTPLSMSGVLGGVDAALKMAQIKNINENTREKKIENDNSESQNATFADLSNLYGIPIHDTGSFNAVKLFQEGAQHFLTRKELEETADMRRKQAEIWNNDPDLQNEWKQSVINTYKQVGEINQKIKAETGKTLQEILNLQEGVHYTRQMIKESISRIDKNTQDVLVGIMQEAKMSEEINTMETQRRLAQNMDYATILKNEAEALESGDNEEAKYWNTVLMYRSGNYEHLIPTAVYASGNAIGTALQVVDYLRGKPKPNKVGFK